MGRSSHSHVLPSDRSFGIVMAAFFALMAFFYNDKLVPLAIASVCFISLAFISPAVLRPLNIIWYRFGILLSKIANPVILFLMYSVIFVPIGLLLRLLGKDVLNLSLKKKTYWINTEKREPIDFTKQF